MQLTCIPIAQQLPYEWQQVALEQRFIQVVTPTGRLHTRQLADDGQRVNQQRSRVAWAQQLVHQ